MSRKSARTKNSIKILLHGQSGLYPRIITVEHTVEGKVGMYFDTGHSEKIPHSRCDSKRTFCLSRKVAGLSPKIKIFILMFDRAVGLS